MTTSKTLHVEIGCNYHELSTVEGHHCRPHVECSVLKQLEDTIEPSQATAHILESWPSAITESQNTSLPPNIPGISFHEQNVEDALTVVLGMANFTLPTMHEWILLYQNKKVACMPAVHCHSEHVINIVSDRQR